MRLQAPPPAVGRETLAAVLGGSLVIGIMTWPAFQAFFVAEAFVYLGLFRAAGEDFVRALFNPIGPVFFRPVAFAASLPWHVLFPPDPWLYHARNFAGIVINVFLLHRILTYLIRSPFARLAALSLFALSKIHFTTIGYIAVFESIVMLMLLLLTVLFFLRFLVHRRPGDYVLGLAVCFLSLFTKDYGAVVVAVVVTLVAAATVGRSDWRTALRRGAVWLAPIPLMVVLLIVLRLAIVQPPPVGAGWYALDVRPNMIALKAYVFASALSNFSLSHSGTVGRPGLGTLVDALPGLTARAGWIDGVALIGLLALVIVTARRGRRAGWVMAVPLVWAVVYFIPPALIRNVQVYYAQESLAGLAVALGLCLDHAGRRLKLAWAVALALIGLSGIVSNYTSLYHWQRSADAAEYALQLVLPYGVRPLASLTFVVAPSQLVFWEWTLSAGGAPLLPVLLGQPGVKVQFADPAALGILLARGDPSQPVIPIVGDDWFTPSADFVEEAARHLARLLTWPTSRTSPSD